MELNLYAVTVRNDVGTLPVVHEDEAFLVKLKLADQDQAVSTQVLEVLRHRLETKHQRMVVFEDLVTQLLTLEGLLGQDWQWHVHEVPMGGVPAHEVRYLLGGADEVGLVDQQERVREEDRAEAVSRDVLRKDPTYLHSDGNLFLRMYPFTLVTAPSE